MSTLLLLLLTLYPLTNAEQLSVPIFSAFSKYGEYYLNISIGSSQNFRCQIDTGSSDLGIPEFGCTTCNKHTDRRYAPRHSSTASAINCTHESLPDLVCHPCHHHSQCAMTISYEDDSGFSADLWWDRFAFESIERKIYVDAVVAGLYKDHRRNPMQPTSIDGILGLAYQSVSSANTKTPLDYLIANHSEVDDIFAFCLDSKDGGVMKIGSPPGDPFYSSPHNAIQWSPLLNKTFYPVNMTSFAVGQNRLNVEPSVYTRGDAIVDSGSTDITLPRAAFDAFRDLMVAQCQHGNNLVGICHDETGHKIQPGAGMFQGLCYSLNTTQIEAFPTLHVRLGDNVSLPLSPNIYVRGGASYCDDPDQVTLGIDSGAVADGTLLGDIFMEGFFTIFDRKNQRIGFAPPDQFCFRR